MPNRALAKFKSDMKKGERRFLVEAGLGADSA